MDSVSTPSAILEDSLIDEFLRDRGLDPTQIRHAHDPESQLHYRHAVAYASGKLAEVECRSHLVSDLHAAKL